MVKKIVAYILVFAMIVSLTIVPVSASGSFGNTITDSSAATALDNYLERQFIVNISLLDFVSAAWNVIDRCFSAAGLDNVHSLDALHAVATRWNQQMNVKSNWPNLLSYIVTSGFDDVPVAKVAYDGSLGVYRLQEYYSGLWLTNSAGHFPYYRPDSSGSTPDPVYRTGQWVEQKNFNESSALWHVVSNYELNEYRDQWLDVMPHCRIMETTNYYWLVASIAGVPAVLCDKYGYPYYVPKEGKTAVSTPNNYYQDTTNQYVDDSITNNYYDYETNEYEYNDNSTNVNVMDGGSALVGSPIDVNNGIINVGGKLQYIDNITYDASTQTYFVNAHDEYVYNSTTNSYTTNFNLYKYEFNIDYTSVTYIGQTEEYNKRYEMYYQLPDGRSSADLTAEDLEQLSIVFADVVGYNRTADSLDMRLLYHFDGNTDDSSYWSYSTSFDWTSGASMTYMDEGEFGGSLYLSEVDHDFTITLPKAYDLNADFTLQFRYYQSHTETPVKDTTFYLGDYAWLSTDGAYYYLPNGTKLAAISVGEWNEICIMRNGWTLCWYINGVFLYSTPCGDSFLSNLRFHFGDDQQTYKKLDELRFTRSAIYQTNADYTPTVVPFDTNLSMVLPDGEYLVADEFFKLNGYSSNYFEQYDLADWSSGVPSGVLAKNKDAFISDLSHQAFNRPMLIYNPDYTTLVSGDGFGSFQVSTSDCLGFESSGSQSGTSYSSEQWLTGGGLFMPICSYSSNSGNISTLWNLRNHLYDYSVWTISFAFSDGTYASYPIIFNSDRSFVFDDTYARAHPSVTVSQVSYQSTYYTNTSYIYQDVTHFVSGLLIEIDPSAEIVYVGLGTAYALRFSLSYYSVFATSGQLEKSPVLAVRSNYEITDYQIGGVRPSYPTKGLVYAMVENSRIVSLQQYTGSAWEAVDGRIWTGERWIPYSSFDVFTLQDFYDIIGGSGDDYEYIYTESGFWRWLQGAWSKMMQKLDAIILALGGDPNALPGSSADDSNLTFWQRVKRIFENALANVIESLLDLITRILDIVLGVIYDLLEFFFGMLTDAVVNGIGGFFDAFMDETLLLFFRSDEPLLDANGQPVLDENGNPVTIPVVALPSGVAAVFAFFSGMIMVLPSEVRYILIFGVSSLFLFAVLKLLKL